MEDTKRTAIQAKRHEYYMRRRDKIRAQYRAKREAMLASETRTSSMSDEERRAEIAERAFRHKMRAMPHCPICGAVRDNRVIVRVCTACGARIGEMEG